MFCPNLSDPTIKKQFDELVEALGEPIAYFVYDRTHGEPLDSIEKFQEIIAKTNDRTQAIQAFSKGFSKKYSTEDKISKIRYNNSKSARENSREARNNKLIDITRNILRDKNTLKDFINPGGFQTLQDLAEQIKEKEGIGSEELDFMSLMTQNQLTVRNMTGKSLVGIAANHNKNYAMRMWTDLALTTSVKFDGNELMNLNGKVGDKKGLDIEGKPISKNLAEFLAAIVDNAKDPVAAFINYNTYTADIISMIVSVGYPLKTAIAFINQPIIKSLVRELQNAPSGKENSVIRQFAADHGIKNINTIEAVNLDTNSLFDSIGSNEMNVNVLKSFLKYKRLAKDFGDLIRAMRSDTQGGAAGPTLSDNSRKINTIDKALKLKYITGVDSIFSEDSKIPYLKEFTDKGVRSATNFMNDYFPNNKPAFNNIRKEIESFLERDLTVKEIEFINSSLISYALSSHPFYKIDNKKKFIEEFPLNVFRLVRNVDELKKNAFLRMIEYNQKSFKNPISYLSYDNTKEVSTEQRDDIINGFNDLLNDTRKIAETLPVVNEKVLNYYGIDENTTFQDLAENLVRYSFYSSGFNFGPNSFFSVVPIEFYTEGKGKDLMIHTDKIMSMSENENSYSGFLDQFYRNNYKKTNYVYTLTNNDKGYPVGLKLIKDASGYSLEIDKDDSASEDLYVEEAGFRPFVRWRIDSNSDVLFKYDEENEKYVQVGKLGVPNILVEYDMDSEYLLTDVTEEKPTPKSFKAEDGVYKDSEIKRNLFGGNTVTTMTNMLGRIAYSDHKFSFLAGKLLEYSKNMEQYGIKVNVGLTRLQDLKENITGNESPAVYVPSYNRIYITEDGRYRKSAEIAALHEAIHAMTVYYLKTNSQAAEDFRKMYEYAKSKTTKQWNEKDKSGLYGYKDMFEFASELMLNSNLVKDLRSMPPSSDIKKYDNLFDEIISKILNFLGLYQGDTAYEQAISILSHVVDYGHVEIYSRAVKMAADLDIQNGLVNPRTGLRVYMSYDKAGETAKKLNTSSLNGGDFVANRIKFERNGKEVWGVKINPKNISPRMDVQGVEVMHETEIDIAFNQITDEDAMEQEKLCR